MSAAAAAAAAAAEAAEGTRTPSRMGGSGLRRHSTPDASSASWSGISPGHVSDALARAAAESDESDNDSSEGGSSESEVLPLSLARALSLCVQTISDHGPAQVNSTEKDCAEADERDDASLAADDAAARTGGPQAKLGEAFRAARRRASVNILSTLNVD